MTEFDPIIPPGTIVGSIDIEAADNVVTMDSYRLKRIDYVYTCQCSRDQREGGQLFYLHQAAGPHNIGKVQCATCGTILSMVRWQKL